MIPIRLVPPAAERDDEAIMKMTWAEWSKAPYDVQERFLDAIGVGLDDGDGPYSSTAGAPLIGERHG